MKYYKPCADEFLGVKVQMNLRFISVILLIGLLTISYLGPEISCNNVGNESNVQIKNNINENENNISNRNSRALADSPWPVFQGDVRHTGLSQYSTKFNQGMLEWKFRANGGVASSPVIGLENNIYVGSYDEYLYSINPNGNLSWKFKTNGGIASSPAVDSDGIIYVGSNDDNLYAIYPNGTLKWKYTTREDILSSPVIDSQGMIYFGSKDFNLYSLDSDGNLNWRSDVGDWIRGSPAIGADGTIYISSDSECIIAYTPNGEKKWEFIGQTYSISAPTVGSDGTVFASSSKYLYAVYPNGTKKWEYITNDRILSSPAIGPDGTIYVGSTDDYLHTIGPDGSYKWKFQTNGDIFSSPAISSEGIIHVGSNDGYLYTINPEGTLRWKFKVSDGVTSSPAIAKSGAIYFGSNDKYIYALSTSTPSEPQNISVIIGDSFVNLSWEPPLIDGGYGILYYTIYRGVSKDKIEQLKIIYNDLLFNDTTVENQIIYYYRISATNLIGEGNLSEIIASIPLSPPDPPFITKVKSGDKYIEIWWKRPNYDGGSEITGYNVYLVKKSIGWKLLATVPSRETYYNDTTVENGKTYYYYITTKNIKGESKPSDTVNATPLGPPNPPKNLQSTMGDNFIGLSWEPPNDDGGSKIKGYNIYKYIGLNDFILLDFLNSTNISYRDISVKNGITYYYHITALNSIGESNPSNKISGFPHTNPSAPYKLKVTVKNDYVLLSWSPPLNDGGFPITEYKIYRGSQIGEEYYLTSVEAVITSFKDKDVENGEKYSYYVTAVNDAGESPPSAQKAVAIDQPWYENLMILSSLMVIIIIILITAYLAMRKKRAFKKSITPQQPYAEIVSLPKTPRKVSPPGKGTTITQLGLPFQAPGFTQQQFPTQPPPGQPTQQQYYPPQVYRTSRTPNKPPPSIPGQMPQTQYEPPEDE